MRKKPNLDKRRQNCMDIIPQSPESLRGKWKETFGFDRIPSYYISKEVAEQLGYKSYLGNLSRVAPNKMLFKGFYENRDAHLPSAPGRIWYEADINYEVGYRGTERILFSNDGLIFVTYDHYHTFVEIE